MRRLFRRKTSRADNVFTVTTKDSIRVTDCAFTFNKTKMSQRRVICAIMRRIIKKKTGF
ncbi:hypothetical protein CW712_04265 [Candidatus Bathyarchaeota archaeon]|nr:MAG: hypothetical protein CW712_04265 [Candidatus Bathyarchaeota archaeon]